MAAISTGGSGGSRRRRRMTATCLLMALVDIPTSILLIPGVHADKLPGAPPPSAHANIGSNLRSLLASGRRHCLSARSSCTAASVLAVSSPNRRGGKRARALDAAAGSSTSKSTVAAYHQDALLDEEATWIMEEEYRGASKRERRKQRRRKQTKDTDKLIKSAEEHEDEDNDDDERWWKTDPWVECEDDVGGVRTKKEDDDAATTSPIEEHPLRTDEWLVRVKVGGFPWLSAKDNGILFTQCSYGDILSKDEDNIKMPKRSQLGRRDRVQRLKFSRSGLVWVMGDASVNSGAATAKTAIGKWKLDHTGLHWDVEVAVPPPPSKAAMIKAAGQDYTSQEQREDQEVGPIAATTVDLNASDWRSFSAIAAGGCKDNKEETGGASVKGWRTTTLHYRADIHLNKFGERPRMFKGIITRDRYSIIGDVPDRSKKASLFGRRLPTRTSLFRPVVATFEACGIGEDTVDLSYRERSSGGNTKQK